MCVKSPAVEWEKSENADEIEEMREAWLLHICWDISIQIEWESEMLNDIWLCWLLADLWMKVFGIFGLFWFDLSDFKWILMMIWMWRGIFEYLMTDWE